MVEIKPIQQHQIEQAKQVVIAVSLEIWQGVLTKDELRRYDSMSDIENVRSHYFDNNGTFLVLVDGEQLVGTGAIRKLDNEICFPQADVVSQRVSRTGVRLENGSNAL